MERTVNNAGLLPALNRYFFSETTSLNLAVIRIVICTVVLFYNLNVNMFIVHDPAIAAIQKPSTFVQLFSGLFSLIQYRSRLFQYLYFLAAACSIFGLFTRPALLVFGITAAYTTGLCAAQGVYNHGLSLLSQIVMILAFVPGSTRLSVDSFLLWLSGRKNRQWSLWEALTLKSTPYPLWGFKLIIILVACTYFTSGLSKVRYGGLKWLDGKTLSHYLDGSASPFTPGIKPMHISPPDVPEREKWKDGFGIYSYSYGNRLKQPSMIKLGQSLAANKVVISGLSVLTVVFEMSGFFLLAAGWPRTIYLFGAIMLHTCIGFLMNLPFTEYRILCLLLVDWKWLFMQIKGWRFRRRAI
ncbi:hypothetical protein DJ568_07690 [Mucilaginibacter hurinus]|uniref:HTTM domain-containing protein n=1 Tax=Mucilaginibacter hurinus TaxID=2201324 RepID=A0A367GRP4_9SPHI|nr:hypothetical protein [Mucilaginibacter hurinus]RCH55755.1 hypothetical protein DJ568_07690 [Mucilaginibacter hurinus]